MSIDLDQVSKRYQGVPVVNDVSIEVAEGEFLVLLGPSGSGKSTLLRAIAGLTEIDRGRVSLHGRDVTHVAAREREVGFVFQHYALFRHMTIAENIEFALRVRHARAAERRARRQELLRLVALEGMDDRLPAQLSGGQQQRIAVARALAHRPKVLLMDEPFGALDAKIREELRRTFRQIQRELGITTILVTHDQEEAFALADRIGVMHQGRLLECGRPDDLYTRPATRFVSTFLGAANLLLGYRVRDGIRFVPPEDARAVAAVPVDEIVTVLRPEEVELAATRRDIRSTFVGHARVEEVLFSGAVERLRVRMLDGGTLAPAVQRVASSTGGALIEVTRALPEKRQLPVVPGQRVALGARRIHVLPTPVSSFSAVATTEEDCARIAKAPLLQALSTRMLTRINHRVEPAVGEPASGKRPRAIAPPGVAAVESGPGGAARVEWLLRHGASQVLCLDPSRAVPQRVVIHAASDAALRPTLAVASSLLRNLPAEATFLDIQPHELPEEERAVQLRHLLDARSEAAAVHGLDVRTEMRVGDPAGELGKELGVDGASLLIIGLPLANAADAWMRLRPIANLLDTHAGSPVLIVRAAA
jgi:ABC-type Fe3+/spermidine/putrescine transport system ATPase subunit